MHVLINNVKCFCHVKKQHVAALKKSRNEDRGDGFECEECKTKLSAYWWSRNDIYEECMDDGSVFCHQCVLKMIADSASRIV